MTCSSRRWNAPAGNPLRAAAPNRATCWSAIDAACPLWEEAGGVFVHHRNVDETLARLKDFFALETAAAAP
jgi:hypothetical protein